MPPTTLKLPVELKRRIQALVEGTGQSAHAFMVAALERETQLAEQRRSFLADALAAREEFARTGIGYRAEDVHARARARAAGRKTARLKPVR